jgi:hypothetical protein
MPEAHPEKKDCKISDGGGKMKVGMLKPLVTSSHIPNKKMIEAGIVIISGLWSKNPATFCCM